MGNYYRRSPAVASRVVDGEAVLIQMPEGMLYVLNRAASEVWVRADGVVPESGLAGDARCDGTHEFLGRMARLGLLENAGSPREAPDV
ncbi:MAG: hypothetical protein ACYS9X_30690, partial [Planctomycetota bacterium]